MDTITLVLILIILIAVYLVYSKKTQNKQRTHQPSQGGQAIKKSYFGWIMRGILAVILFIILSFHILPDHLMIFPKEHLTFSNTFINKSDVDNLIDRYNNANFFEQQAIRQEPLARKLMEKGIIYNEKSEQKTNSDHFESPLSKKAESLEYWWESENKIEEEIGASSKHSESIAIKNRESEYKNRNQELEKKIEDDISNLPKVKSANENAECECDDWRVWVYSEPSAKRPFYTVLVQIDNAGGITVLYEYHVYITPEYKIILHKEWCEWFAESDLEEIFK